MTKKSLPEADVYVITRLDHRHTCDVEQEPTGRASGRLEARGVRIVKVRSAATSQNSAASKLHSAQFLAASLLHRQKYLQNGYEDGQQALSAIETQLDPGTFFGGTSPKGRKSPPRIFDQVCSRVKNPVYALCSDYTRCSQSSVVLI